MSSPARARLGLILAAAAWGVGTVVSKRAVAEIPPLTLLPIQLAASLVVLAGLMRWRGIGLVDPSASPLLGRFGVLNPGLAYALSLVGLTQITASLSVLLWALEPILILLLAALVPGRARARRRAVALGRRGGGHAASSPARPEPAAARSVSRSPSRASCAARSTPS